MGPIVGETEVADGWHRIHLPDVVVLTVNGNALRTQGCVVATGFGGFSRLRKHRAAVVIPGCIKTVRWNRVHPHPIAVGNGVAVEGLCFGYVGARVGAPGLTDAAHRSATFTQQRGVGFPVHLFVFKTYDGNR